ncbi:transient receptor potential-gamma protein-like isoform X1 [Maniola jurtina]|uniref:transient receptor potential-gamma protein-like isoform X1 n=1 Tax=Maniola jurtina TaxID=191418 RepID=UPI001E689D67|nr:transient receptor potential-gamma protein-like isoform X1 [Maniola jurtina]XP_045763147.1 transient receptor potential-gamma protein-like isoform X1 [Maniola jurtina]
MSGGSGGGERARRASTCRVEMGALLAPEPRPLDNKVKRHSIHGMTEEENVVRPHQEMEVLSLEEKKYLLGVERGDVAGTRRVLQRARDTGHINVDCVDPLGRSALLMAIDNENLEMVELLLEFGVETRDALLHAISEEFVEAVEALLDHEERTRKQGELHSWEALPPETATFTSDITPLILAAHRDSYEIIKLLLDRGAELPMPHDVRCACDDCVRARREDSLRHSRSRINAYRALASPSLIALSSKDPILTAFELSWELRRLSALEHEFKTEYQELRVQCQEFATALLDHTRTSHELQVLLNHEKGSPQAPLMEPGAPERMRLSRLKLAIKLRQKKFVAHPNVQQLLASIWYESVPGFRRKNMLLQAAEMVRIGAMFPLYSLAYIAAPHSAAGRTLRKPFIKFLCHSASYFMFLFLLILASQRIETAASGLFWGAPHTTPLSRRGAPPSLVEWLILAWVSGLIWSEVKQLWDMGLREYVHDMWNVIDFVTNSLYVATVALRIVSHFQVRREMTLGLQWNQPREKWDAWDPMLLSEGLFSAANIFSSLKLVYIFSVNPHLGPLQVSLSRMVLDILKFFVLDILVIFAFSCGLNQLLWYYADMEKKKCHISSSLTPANGTLLDPDACVVWRRFANLFETMQTLFWAAFGLVDLDSFELEGIKIFTRFWGMLMFGTYAVINVIVLLNLLIAMMNHSYQLISERADVEWKFARSKLWISYFEEGGTAPPPFNVVPSPKSMLYAWSWLQRRLCGQTRAKREHMRTIRRKAKQANERDFRYQAIMRNLVRRYVTVQQRRAECGGVTEDDVNEIKQDVSAFRCELVEILRNSGMNTSTANAGAPVASGGGGGKKNRQKERRLMKGFNIAPGGSLPPVDEFFASLHHEHEAHGAHHASLSALLGQRLRASQSSLSDGGPSARRKPPHKRRWGTIIEAARAARVSRLIGRSRSEDSVCDHARPSPSGSERSDSGSDSQRSPERVTRSGPLHPLSALAALKRKRKKFSDSRRAAEGARAASGASEALQRASSVPARAPPAPPPRAPRPPAPSVSPSTTTESVAGKGGSREPLLASLEDDALKEACGQCGYEGAPDAGAASAEAEDARAASEAAAREAAEAEATCSRCAALARLAGVTPLAGHAPHHSAGWL